jgi:PPM family protein phosphatase
MMSTTPDSSPAPFKVRSAGHSDVGRRRPTNEDQFLIAELTKTMTISQSTLGAPALQTADERGSLFLVADGMGGHQAGEHASALAVAVIQQFTLNAFKWFPQDARAEGDAADLERAITRADAAIVAEASRQPELAGMGTTLTLAYAVGRRLFILHVGDSRAYLLRRGALTQITHDHTVVAELVRRGDLEPADVARHPLRHVITNVLGGREPGVRAESHVVDLEAGDSLLLCTDGLTEMASADEISRLMVREGSPERTVAALVDLANERGGVDNITVIVARFEA